MRRLLVLGAGTAGTMVVNKLRPKLGKHDWQITVVDQDASHLYQPGLLLLPFGQYSVEELIKRRQDFVPEGVTLLIKPVDRIDADVNRVLLQDGTELEYDYLV
ncbi:MAG TPA: hypothetical protein VL281_12030, partial [Mycobacteriales bacterium]|nr:hypothetical protein [Mycobacteriales bacterium]